ncbi:hypothetical protein [Austwickia chelonae]|uniref:hypothetical protein n=1 Tax=Austwickia chelonae TaxID=100225 RepID=UPI0013C2FAB3|nr:hypothetical protein [Austwickia chelonae]
MKTVGRRVMPTFRASDGALKDLQIPLAAMGGFGETTTGSPLTVHLCGPAPTRFAFVGAASLATALCLRAAASGAEVMVATDRPAPWQMLAAQVGGEQPFMTVYPAGALPAVTGAQGALLTVFDHIRGSGEGHISRSPWHTSVHVVSQVEPSAQTLFDAMDLIAIGREGVGDVDLILQTLRLPEAMSSVFLALHDDEVLVATRTVARLVRIRLTDVEWRCLGSVNGR